MVREIWIVHFSILLITLILIIIGVMIARLLKGKKRWFYQAHKILEGLAVILAVIAALITGFNFAVGPHAFIGFFTMIGLIIVLIIGILYDRTKSTTEDLIAKKKMLRKIHIILGFLFIILVIIAIMNILTLL
jgi:cytochrome b561